MNNINRFSLLLANSRQEPDVWTLDIEDMPYVVIPENERYLHTDQHLDIRLVDINNKIRTGKDFKRISIKKLSRKEKESFRKYLIRGKERGDNIGHLWAFFRPKSRKEPVIAYGANVVSTDKDHGKNEIEALIEFLKSKRINHFRVLYYLFILTAIILFSVFIWKSVVSYLDAAWFRQARQVVGIAIERVTGVYDEMSFYRKVFPDLYEWKIGTDRKQKEIAESILQPEYLEHIMVHTKKTFWTDSGMPEAVEDKATRFILYDLFNYNEEIRAKYSQYKGDLLKTNFSRLYEIFSIDGSSIGNNVLYYKVGDIDLNKSAFDEYLKNNFVQTGFSIIEEKEIFKDLQVAGEIKQKLIKMLDEGLYMHTPLRIANPANGIEWYLCVKRDRRTDRIDFASFFKAHYSTLVPKHIGEILLGRSRESSRKQGFGMTWYKIDPDQAMQLKLRDSSIGYFQRGSTQTLQTDIIQDKIRQLGLEKYPNVQVEVYRDILIGKGNVRYGFRANDPIISLILTNLIQDNSFAGSKTFSLKRDVVPIHITSIQLSKAYNFSARVTDVFPGREGIIEVFADAHSFKAEFAGGKQETFVKTGDDLFNPYGFRVVKNTIAFISKDEIDQMTINIDGGHRFKIIRDGLDYKIISLR